MIVVQPLRSVCSAVRQQLAELTLSGGEMQDWLHIVSPAVWIAVARQRHSIVGWSALVPLYSNKGECLIGVFVTKKERRKGLGTQLVNDVIHRNRMRTPLTQVLWSSNLPKEIVATIEYWEATHV